MKKGLFFFFPVFLYFGIKAQSNDLPAVSTAPDTAYVSYELKGRKLLFIPKPENWKQEGIAVVIVQIDEKGDVVNVKIHQGQTTVMAREDMMKLLSTAKQAKFDAFPGANIQTGFIRFKLVGPASE